MDACVMGAGIVGLATAYELQRQGMRVTVIDQGPVGGGASGGNGAQLSYSYVQPLADPGLWAQLPKLLLSRESPLQLRLQWDPHQWQWALRFLAACNSATSRRTTEQLLALAAHSRAGFEAMRAREALDCDFSDTGKLVLYGTREGLAGAERQMELQRAWGSEQASISAQRCVELEPALAHHAAHIAGAIHTPSECAADCQKVCEGLHALLAQRGARFELGAQVQGFDLSQGRIAAVRTTAGPIEADRFVLALGSGSVAVANQLGVRLPAYPIKGYSVTLDAPDHAPWAPRMNVTHAGRKVVFARLGQRLRVAGMAELVGQDRSISPARIDSLRATVRAVLGHEAPADALRPWTGMRPATPTGLPIAGRAEAGPDNLWINTGHGALGFTLAFGTAALLARQMQQAPAQA
ncbi:D-amino acid dehydrogenase [Paracidovorax valerianellae]|nr:D-amino acid dehydrogenase [Paracidovorax valerianellae]MDA8444045.1 D-amino acid dehydrogenase [Paracidovorax valerianellae]